MDGGVKFGKLKCCVVIIVNDDGNDFWNIYYLLLKIGFLLMFICVYEL